MLQDKDFFECRIIFYLNENAIGSFFQEALAQWKTRLWDNCPARIYSSLFNLTQNHRGDLGQYPCKDLFILIQPHLKPSWKFLVWSSSHCRYILPKIWSWFYFMFLYHRTITLTIRLGTYCDFMDKKSNSTTDYCWFKVGNTLSIENKSLPQKIIGYSPVLGSWSTNNPHPPPPYFWFFVFFLLIPTPAGTLTLQGSN